MSRFKFRLQRVLELRERHEEAMATQLAEQRGATDRARSEHDAIVATRQQGAESLLAAQHGATIGQLQNLALVLGHIDQQVAVAGRTIREAEEKERDAQRQLTEAAQARRIIDRLKENELVAWRRSADAADRLLMDEIALARFGKLAATSGDAA